MKTAVFFFLAVILSASCTKKDNTEPTTVNPKLEDSSGNSSGKWAGLSKVLDYYDEVMKVESDFSLEAMAGGKVTAREEGKYSYSKGQSRWEYYSNGNSNNIHKIIECYADKVVVKKIVGRRKKREKIVQEVEGKFPCLIQSLVHYSGALKKNILNREDKTYVVNEIDRDSRKISRVSYLRGGAVVVYKFSNIQFTPMPGSKPLEVKKTEKPAVEVVVKNNSGKSKNVEPAKEVKKPAVKTGNRDEEEPPL
ncbi:MAG: hypothetical protein JXR95_11015 [Deltaproteobacteria bacterium]|nr:hypothetical protein [Deltaproteobacteria bacterium]